MAHSFRSIDEGLPVSLKLSADPTPAVGRLSTPRPLDRLLGRGQANARRRLGGAGARCMLTSQRRNGSAPSTFIASMATDDRVGPSPALGIPNIASPRIARGGI